MSSVPTPVAPAGEPVLACHGLTVGYGDLAAVRDLDLVAHAGEIVALIGPNGAGKTTTLLALAGALSPLAGEVHWRGRATTAPMHVRVREGMGFVAESGSVLMRMSVRDNLRLGGGRIETVLELFPELERLLDRQAGLLSGGEQQMLTVGRALSRSPQLLLIDELSLGLAPIVVQRLMSALRTATDELGVGVVMVEQQARRALNVADRWYLMRQGRLTASGTRDTTDAAIAGYLAGDPQEQGPGSDRPLDNEPNTQERT